MKSLVPFILLSAFIVSCGSPEKEANADNMQQQNQHEKEMTADSTEAVATLEEYKVPWDDTRSRDPNVAPDGTVFFAGQVGDYIGSFNPETEEFKEYPLDDGAGPHTVSVADNGTVWYTGNTSQHIGKLNPETGDITKYPMEDDHAQDPHTIAFADNGNFWFTSQGANGISYFNVNTGEATTIAVPTENALPYGIRMAPDGERPYIALLGTNKLATVNPETMEIEEIELPREDTRPRRLDILPDGTVWYGDFMSGYIGRYNPEDGSIEEWMMPDGADSQPYGVLADDQGRIWFATTGFQPNKLYAFDSDKEEFITGIEIPSGEGAIRHMDFDKETRSLWFGTDTGHIGRLVLN
jgi:virginiamycin B lyase